MAEKPGPPELEAARHISSAAARANCGIRFAFFFLFTGGPGPWNGAIHIRVVFPHHLTQKFLHRFAQELFP